MAASPEQRRDFGDPSRHVGPVNDQTVAHDGVVHRPLLAQTGALARCRPEIDSQSKADWRPPGGREPA
jgi:hypothetical protein